jgi:hypothetical protein
MEGHLKETKNSHNLFSGFARKARGRSEDDATGDAYLYAYDTDGIAIASILVPHFRKSPLKLSI